MGLMTPRRRTRAAWVLLGLVAAAAAFDAARLLRQQHWNTLIEAGQVAPEAAGVPPEARFAQAHAAAASGAIDAALKHFRTLHDDAALGAAARYNSANLLMRQAIALRAGSRAGKSIALIELAKETYRDLLRADPQHWQARYNLERAQRLLAEPDELEAAPAESRRDAERAATTMRGYSPGLP